MRHSLVTCFIEMFEVIKFTDDEAIEVVPTCWLGARGKVCKWPPYRPHIVTKAVRNQEEPKEDWAVYPIQRLDGPCKY